MSSVALKIININIRAPTLFDVFINALLRELKWSTGHGIPLLDTEVKCLLFADDLVFLSPTKEGLQKQLDLVHRFS